MHCLSEFESCGIIRKGLWRAAEDVPAELTPPSSHCTVSHTLCVSHCLTASLRLNVSLSHCLTVSLPHCLAASHCLAVSLPHCLIACRCRCLSLSRCHTHYRTASLSLSSSRNRTQGSAAQRHTAARPDHAESPERGDPAGHRVGSKDGHKALSSRCTEYEMR